MNKALLFIVLGSIIANTSAIKEDSGLAFGTYFANWAQYHAAPYKYTAENLAPIADKLTHIFYGFIVFCPPADQPQPYWVTDLGVCQGKNTYDLVTLEPKDPDFIKTIIGYKSSNPNLKVVASMGGWNFPSSFYSEVFSTSANRAKLISAIAAFTQQYGFDGIDIDWEYPCSEPRSDPVKITCWSFKTVKDNGGDCPSKQFEHGVCSGTCNDADNLANFFEEFKTAHPSIYLSVAATANTYAVKKGYNVPKSDKYLDHWNLMTYDYWVSDIKGANVTAPNQNLRSIPALADWSVADTIDTYLNLGATASKLLLGVAYYGHTWYVPGITDNSWQGFNLPATVQGVCCGPFQQTYGAKPGKGCSQCGTMMFSEITNAGFMTHYDSNSASMIGYLAQEGKDGYTPAGTWVSYLDEQSITAQIDYAKTKGLGGAFVFDSSMDSVENSQFTYKLSHAAATALGH